MSRLWTTNPPVVNRCESVATAVDVRRLGMPYYVGTLVRHWDELVRRVRERGPASLARAVRLSVAAVAPCSIALSAVSDAKPVTAALTALLIVQVTLVGTLAETVRRILS